MKALIKDDGTIAEIVTDDSEFPVAPPLRWKDAPLDVTKAHVFDGQAFVLPKSTFQSLPVIDLVASKINEINNKCEGDIDALKAGYPDNEIQTWSKQELEARAFNTDSSSHVPFITALATERGIDVAELANRIIAKADAFAAVAAAAIGKRQRLEDELTAIVSANALPSTDPGYMDDDTARAAIEALVW